jgi:Tol biopolymer transport system component
MTSRPLLITGLAASVATLAVAGVALLSLATDERPRISTAELRGIPPIALVWADRERAQHSGSGDLYVVRADEAEPRRIRAWQARFRDDQAYGTYAASWSPDRRQIALELSVWFGDPYTQVAVVTADGRQLRKLTDASVGAGNTLWSPDGRSLVYSYHSDLWTYTPKTGRARRIWRAGRPDGDAFVAGVDWSPDGRRLVVAMDPLYVQPLHGIVSMSFDGADVVRLTFGDDIEPRWSPDGRRIAFVRGGNIHIVGADGRGLRRLINRAVAPVWSPDGRSLLFNRRGAVYAAGADGRSARRLTSDGFASTGCWSPDGSKILFTRETWDEDRPQTTWSELWVMDADGGRQTRLPFNRPRWSVISADWE